jgi:glutamate dehydrogenase/leucine dehydrogenase
MEQQLERYKSKKPEIVFEWHDAQTDAVGWVVINSLRGGAAGGGTRMRKGLNKEEVISLAKVMEVKFSVCGPHIGGAKSGINFDPKDPRKEEVLSRWFKAVMPLLKTYYGTGGDLDVDIKDVIEHTEEYGLWHPQEGIVNGHIKPNEGKKVQILGDLRNGVSKRIETPRFIPTDTTKRYTIADMITGYGVAKSVEHYYDLYRHETLKDKRVTVQGWGNVAAAAAFYLAKEGAKIVAIIDRVGGIVRQEGLSLEEVESLFTMRNGNALVGAEMGFQEVNEQIWNVPTDIFIPGAASKLVTRPQVDAMLAGGLEVISCGANVPFIDDDVFFGATAKYTDTQVALIPDFIANCGMARVFAYLMSSKAEPTDESIFGDVSRTIRKALKEVHQAHPQATKISTEALAVALNKLLGEG